MLRNVLFGILFIICLKTNYQSEGLEWNNDYDFIIVGGGTAGCVIASRLSENPDVSVLLLEAGPVDLVDPFVPVPRTTLAVIRTGSKWRYNLEPQEYIDDKVYGITVAKMLGGSSSMNGMTIARASKHDFDKIASLGNEGWSYDDVLPYYVKYENVIGEELAKNSFRGKEGPVSIRLAHKFPMTDLFINGGKELGWTFADYFGPQINSGGMSNGFGYGQTNVGANGRRSSTAESHIRPILGRWNLDIITEAIVTKIQIDNVRATGVHFEKDGMQHFVHAKKEVVLSSGSIGSAHLLMASGIGPKDHLQDIGIDVKKDLPVARAIKDRFVIRIKFSNIGEKISTTTNTFEDLFEYIFTGNGSWTSIGPLTLALFRTKSQPEDNNSSFIMLSVRQDMPPMPISLANMVRNSVEFEDTEEFQGYKHNQDGKETFTAWMFHLSTRTAGELNLKTSNIFDHPKYNLNFMKDERDYADFIEGIRLLQDLHKTKSIVDKGVEIIHNMLQNCNHTVQDSDEYWKCFIKSNGTPAGQQFGTCPMGPDSDPQAVVDNRLRVKGIHGLRVADASIIPIHISGNPVVQVMMIGEKAADIIKQDNM